MNRSIFNESTGPWIRIFGICNLNIKLKRHRYKCFATRILLEFPFAHLLRAIWQHRSALLPIGTQGWEHRRGERAEVCINTHACANKTVAHTLPRGATTLLQHSNATCTSAGTPLRPTEISCSSLLRARSQKASGSALRSDIVPRVVAIPLSGSCSSACSQTFIQPPQIPAARLFAVFPSFSALPSAWGSPEAGVGD